MNDKNIGNLIGFKWISAFLHNLQKLEFSSWKHLIFCIYLLYCTTVYSGWPWPEYNAKYMPRSLNTEHVPDWIKTQVENSLSYYKGSGISKSSIDDYYQKIKNDPFIRVTIKNNSIYIDKPAENLRIDRFHVALTLLSAITVLPDATFIIAYHDSIPTNEDVPIFVMAKNKNLQTQILIPDFEAIAACYQVLKDLDITEFFVPWHLKHTKLIWRGGSVQSDYPVTPENFRSLSRFILCDLSIRKSDLIDAKFTLWGHNHLINLPDVKKYEAKYWPSYEEQLEYKYHIMIDGTTCAYSASGWKWFTNSLVFKVDSPNIQWYYSELIPYVHYIPVQSQLEDLEDKLEWARLHDSEAKRIAENARNFAKEHITVDKNLIYLFHLILKYSQLLID